MPYSIVRDDITHVRADAIVNAANEQLLQGGGVCGAIFRAAGARRLRDACDRIGHCDTGSAVATPAYRLHAKYVIHAVGPVWRGGMHGERRLLASCYRRSLELADQLKCRSIAFPLISSGIYGYPKQEALEVAQAEIRAFLDDHEMDVKLVLFDSGSMELASDLKLRVERFIDDVYVGASGYDERRSWESMEAAQMASVAAAREEMESQADYAMDLEWDESAWDEWDEPAWDEPAAAPSDALTIEKQETPTTSRSFCPFCGSPLVEGVTFCPHCGHSLAVKDAAPAPGDTAGLPYSAPTAAPMPGRPADSARVSYAPKPAAPMAAPAAPGRTSAAPRIPFDLPGSLARLLEHMDAGFSETLLAMIDERGLTDAEVYKRANISRQHFSKIRSNPRYRPKKNTVLALAVALELSADETQLLLERAGFALTHADRRDVIVEFFIREGTYDVFQINNALFYYDQPLLG